MLDRSQQPPLRDLEEYNIQQPVCRELPSGVKLYVLDAGDTQVMRIDLVFGAGKFHQDHMLQCLFTNRMLREGTHRLGHQEIAEKLDFYGAWMEQNVSFSHSFVTLYSLNKFVEPTLELLAEMVKEPLFDEQVLDVVRRNNLQRHLVAMKKTSVRARRLLLQSIYSTDYIYGHMAEEHDYLAINSSMLTDYHRRYYHSHNLSIYLSGHVTDTCLQLVEHLFGQPFGQGEIPSRDYPPTPSLPPVRCFLEMKDSVQSSVILGKSVVGNEHPDCLKLRVLITILGGFFGSRLMKTVREEKGFTYGIYSILNPSPTDNTLMILSDCAHEYVSPLLEEVCHQIDMLQQEPVGEEELTLVKNYMKGEVLRTYDSRLSLSDAWTLVHTMGLPETYYRDYWQAISQTTSEDLLRLARTYLAKESLTEVVAGQKMF